MTNPLVVVTTEVLHDVPQCRGLWLWCPGCEKAHRPRTALPDGTAPGGPPLWDWNGQVDERFTISPSLLCNGITPPTPAQLAAGIHRCHSFIRDGRWEFLGDCTHQLAGQTVPMLPVPDWMVRRGAGDYS